MKGELAMDTDDRRIDVARMLNDRKLNGFNYKLIILSWLITASSRCNPNVRNAQGMAIVHASVAKPRRCVTL